MSIELLTGKRPRGSRYDERKWSIMLPRELANAIAALPGARVGRRINQPASLPRFVEEARCPVALVREFLGGLFGQTVTPPACTARIRTSTARSLLRLRTRKAQRPGTFSNCRKSCTR